jgi:hypothetical protein
MNTLLVKDLPCVDGLDQQALRSVRGGKAAVNNANLPPLPPWIGDPLNQLTLPGLGALGSLPGHYPGTTPTPQLDPGFSPQAPAHTG